MIGSAISAIYCKTAMVATLVSPQVVVHIWDMLVAFETTHLGLNGLHHLLFVNKPKIHDCYTIIIWWLLVLGTLDNLHLYTSQHSQQSANSQVTLGIGFNSLPSTFTQLVDFTTKCLRKTVHSVVDICSSVLDVRDVRAILLNIYFLLTTIYSSPFRLIAFYF